MNDSVQKLLSVESARAAKLDRRVTELETQLRLKTEEASRNAMQRDAIHAQALALGRNFLKPSGSMPAASANQVKVNAADRDAGDASARASALQAELDDARRAIEDLQLQLRRQASSAAGEASSAYR